MMGCQGSEGGDICIHIANALHYTVESSTILNNNDTPMKKKKSPTLLGDPDVRLLLFFLLALRIIHIIFLNIFI